VQLLFTIACSIGVTLKLIGPMMDSQLQLPTLASYPYSLDVPLYFWLSYVHQMYVGGAIISMHIGSDTMHSGFLIQLCTQLRLLKCRLQNFYQVSLNVKMPPHGSSMYAKMEEIMIKQCIEDHKFVYR
jgi:hypothetical protein